MSQKQPPTNQSNKIGVSVPMALRNKKVVSLSLQQSRGERKLMRFNKERVVIGSVVSADLKLTGHGVSPIHAVLEIQHDPMTGKAQATVYDLASDTGVFVNGDKAITQLLKSGDEIRIGHHSLKFALDDVDTFHSSSTRMRESEGRKLFLNPDEDLAPLILEDERNVEEVFDYRPTSKSALEMVMSWSGSILDVEHFVNQKQVILGSVRGADFAIPEILSSPRFPIVTRMGEAFVLNLDKPMRGVFQRDGKLQTLDQIRAQASPGAHGVEVPLRKNDFAKITVGEIDFYLSFTQAPPRLKRARIFDRDPLFMRLLATSGVLTAITLFALMNAQVPQTLEAEQIPERIATILYQPEKYMAKPKAMEIRKPEPVEVAKATPPKPVPPKPQPTTKLDLQPSQQTAQKPVPKEMNTAQSGAKPSLGQASKSQSKGAKGQNQAKEGEGARAKGAEGERGRKNAPAAPDKQTVAKRPSPQGGTGRGGGNSQVNDIGNVDFLKGASSKIQNILSNTNANLGGSGSKLQGFGGFDTQGKGGLALSGGGKGGGGDAESLGGLGKQGRGGGRVGTGLGAAGTGSGIIGGKTRVEIRRGGTEESIIMGAIDRDAVEAAIQAHRDEFRLCYEREINAETPKLAGRVSTSFVIGASGRVTQTGVESTTLKNPNAERCILNVIKRIDFPTPRGGGVVQVSYPFKFNAVN